MRANTTTFWDATIFAMDKMIYLTLGERGSPSFVTQTFLSTSPSISFISGSYTKPLRLERKGMSVKSEIVLFKAMVKECRSTSMVLQCIWRELSLKCTTSLMHSLER